MPKVTDEQRKSIPEAAATLEMSRVRAALAAHRIKRDALARLAGVSPSHVSNILNGRDDGLLGRAHIYRALQSLGLEREVRHDRH